MSRREACLYFAAFIYAASIVATLADHYALGCVMVSAGLLALVL